MATGKRKTILGDVNIPTGENFLGTEEQPFDPSQLSIGQMRYLESQAGGASGIRQGGKTGIGYTGAQQAALASAGEQLNPDTMYNRNTQRTQKVFRTASQKGGPNKFSAVPPVSSIPEDASFLFGKGEGKYGEGNAGGTTDDSGFEEPNMDPYSLGKGFNWGDLATFTGPASTISTIAKGLDLPTKAAIEMGLGTLAAPQHMLQFAGKQFGKALATNRLTNEYEMGFEKNKIKPGSQEAIDAVSAIESGKFGAPDDSINAMTRAEKSRRGISTEEKIALASKKSYQASGFINKVKGTFGPKSESYQERQSARSRAKHNWDAAEAMGISVEDYLKMTNNDSGSGGEGGEGGTFNDPRSDQSQMSATESRYGGMGAQSNLGNGGGFDIDAYGDTSYGGGKGGNSGDWDSDSYSGSDDEDTL